MAYLFNIYVFIFFWVKYFKIIGQYASVVSHHTENIFLIPQYKRTVIYLKIKVI